MQGYLRIGSKRADSPVKPNPGDIVIDGDRKNPILGNPFILKNHHDEKERAEVIEKFRLKYEKDWAENGPMRKETERLAAEVAAGKKITALCWCKPRPCHLDLVQARVKDIVIGPGHYDQTVATHLESLNRLRFNETPLL